MKHILLFTAAVILSFGSFAQTCTPDGSFVGSSAGLYPAGPLGPTCELIAAKTIVSLTDTTVSITNPIPLSPTLYITRMRINNITGLPAGLQVSTDVIGTADLDGAWGYWDNSGTWPNQTAALGCAYVYGTSGDWDAAALDGGPNNDGKFPLVFEVDAYVAGADPAVLGFIGGPQWVSTIDPASGGGTFLILDTLLIPTNYAELEAAITGDANVAPATQYTYSTAMVAGATYNWTATNGTIVSGQGTNEVVVEWTGSGNIEVDLADGGCQGTDNMDVTANPTAIDEAAGINASVYPNPSNGIFNLQLESADALNIRVLDITGKVILSETLAGSTLYNINMQAAKAGVYVMEIETAEGRTFKRLIKN